MGNLCDDKDRDKFHKNNENRLPAISPPIC